MKRMGGRRIAPVADNTEKQATYKEQMQRFAKAMKEGFFFEAILIDYAMLEDRLRSMLYHAAFFANRKATGSWKKTKPYFQTFVHCYRDEKENKTLGVTNISGKIKVFRSMLRWISETEDGYQHDKYLKTLKNRCESMDIGALLDTLDAIRQWCDYRNEIVHALLNKNTASVYAELEAQAQNGMKYARLIDSQVRILKKGNLVRKSANAPIE